MDASGRLVDDGALSRSKTDGSVSDQVRRDSTSAMARFKDPGIRCMGILSGDHRKAVDRVAADVGVADASFRLKPADKVLVIKRYQAENTPVMFIGDGVNDAPALACSHVAAAMGPREQARPWIPPASP